MFDAFVERLPAEGDILVVGAGSGQQATELARLRPKCRIYAVEPDPRRFTALAGAARSFDNISLVQCGFSDREGQVQFPDWPDGNAPVVAAMPLDAYAVPRGLKVVGTFIATRGIEPAVLMGGMEALRRHRAMISLYFSPRNLTISGYDPAGFRRSLLQDYDIEIGANILAQGAGGPIGIRLKLPH